MSILFRGNSNFILSYWKRIKNMNGVGLKDNCFTVRIFHKSFEQNRSFSIIIVNTNIIKNEDPMEVT